MTLIDTLWGEEKYNLVITAYTSKVLTGKTIVSLSMLNRNNGHVQFDLFGAAQWNVSEKRRKAAIEAIGTRVQKMDATCTGRKDPIKGHLCTITVEQEASIL